MSLLLLQLPLTAAAPDEAYVFALSPDGQNIAHHAAAIATELPNPGRAAEVVAVVPPQALSWHKASLPAGIAIHTRNANSRLRSVLEGLLEERLLDEPQLLHLALQPAARAGEDAWVAVCDRAWLHAHLQHLEAAGRKVDRIVAEITPAAEGDAPRLWAVGTADSAWLLASGCSPSQGLAWAPLSASGLALLGAAPGQTVQALPAVAALAEQQLQHPVQLLAVAERLLEASRSPWNLAQFDLNLAGRDHRIRRLAGASLLFARAAHWRAARWAIAVLIIAQLIGLNALAWKERQALATKRAAVRTSLTQTFPQIKLVVDAPVQMEREVAQLRERTGSLTASSLEPLLAAAGQVLPQGAQPQAIEYSNQELRLRGLALPPAAQEHMQTQLAALGYSAHFDAQSLSLRAKEQP